MGRRTNAKMKANKKRQRKTARFAKIRTHNHADRVDQASKYIRNLSNSVLKEAEITALGKGLNFVPFTQLKTTEIVRAFMKTERIMRLKVMFGNEQKPDKRTIFKNKSNFSPLYSSSNKLETYLCLTKIDLAKITLRKTYNLTRSDAIALQKLKIRDDIIIRNADKGNTVVILNKGDYIDEGLRQLNDGIHYEKIDNINIQETKKIVLNHVALMYNQNEINKCTHDFLYDMFMLPKTPYIYFLPKIHKVASILCSIDPLKKDPSLKIRVPGRPIIAQCGAATEKIGRFLDCFLKPIVQKQHTYIRDTKEFITKLEQIKVPKSALLITYDVTSLYTNLRFEELLSSLKTELDDNMDLIYDIQRPSTASLVRIAEILLTKNEFSFNGNSYKQIIGAPQGAVPSPEICDIAIFYHINKIMDKFSDRENIVFHVRFRDDGFIIYNGNEENAIQLFDIANSAHDLLKFTYEISQNNAVFLDTHVYKGANYDNCQTLDIKCHTKPTETFQYLHRDSCHPPSVFHSFMIGEVHRYLRNTNNMSEFEKKLSNFKTHLIARGYKRAEINKCLRTLNFNDRKYILTKRKKDESKRPITYSMRYHPYASQVSKCLNKHWQLIEGDETLSKLFPTKIAMAFRKGKTIGNRITNNKVD